MSEVYPIREATVDIPWSMDVVAVMPEEVVQTGAHVVGGAAQGRWQCVVVDTDFTIYIWYTALSDTLVQQKQGRFLKLTPQISKNATTTPIISLQVAPQAPDTCYLHVLCRTTNTLQVWEISAAQIRHGSNMVPSSAASAVLPVEDGDAVASLHVQNNDLLLLVGTEKGRSIWIQQTSIPIALHVQQVEKKEEINTGLFSRLLGTTPSKQKSAALVDSSPILANLVVEQTEEKTRFVAVRLDGRITEWTANHTESHKVVFSEPKILLNLQDVISDHTVQVLAATRQDQHLYFMFLATDRLYWVHYNSEIDDTIFKCLTRFADPTKDVQVEGMVANGTTAYAVLTLHASSIPRLGAHEGHHGTLCVALHNGEVYEADLELKGSVTTVLGGSLAPDVATHGITMWDASGVQVRARLHHPNAPKSTTGAPAVMANPSTVHILTQHLRFFFWNAFKHPDRSLQLPPSLQEAEMPNVEAAILALAQQLQTSIDPLHHHLTLVRLLQQTSIYRTVSLKCRWRLLSLGQQAAVHAVLRTIKGQTAWERKQMMQLLSPDQTDEWLLGVLQDVSDDEQASAVARWLCAAVDKAMEFRQDHASPTYDVTPNELPRFATLGEVPIWTNSPVFWSLWARQMEVWRMHPSTATSQVVETFFQAYLQACSDGYASCPNPETKERFVRAQRECFEVLRQVNGWEKDQLLFELCVAHCFFGGVCQISLDHEQRGDRTTFALDNWDHQKNDVDTDLSYGEFVLKWFADRGQYGHVLRYGTSRFPNELSHLMKTEDQVLQPYQWIHAIQLGDYNQVADSLLENALAANAKLPKTLTFLSAARLADQVADDHSPSKRRRLIEKKLELVNAQKELLKDSAFDSELWSPEKMHDCVLRKLDETSNAADKAEMGIVGLAICTAFESTEDSEENAGRIWSKIILADNWHDLLEDETDLTDERLCETIRQNTVFGMLLEKSEETTGDDWKHVVIGNQNVESAALSTFGSDDLRMKMHRVLRSVVGTRLNTSL